MSTRADTGEFTVVTIAVVIGGLYLLSRAFNVAGQVVSAGAGMIANLWVGLTTSPIQLKGTFMLPDGTQLPLQNYPIRQDASGNVFTRYNETVYQLAPWVLDSGGNPTYPATPVGT